MFLCIEKSINDLYVSITGAIMKIILILLGLGLAVAFVIPAFLETLIVDPAIKAVLFYTGVIILIGGLGGVADWLEHKSKNNQDEIKI